jgi:hypothetical protein
MLLHGHLDDDPDDDPDENDDDSDFRSTDDSLLPVVDAVGSEECHRANLRRNLIAHCMWEEYQAQQL